MGHLVSCQNENEGYAGEIHHNVNFNRICQATIADVTDICDHTYGRTPAIEVKNKLKKKFTYLPGHIHVILVELPPRDNSIYGPNHIPKPDYEQQAMEESRFRQQLEARNKAGKKNEKKHDDPYYCGLRSRIPNFAKSKA